MQLPRAMTSTWTGPTRVHRPTRPRPVRDERLGQYVVKQLLGEGGMSRVYLAENEMAEREVAIKRLLPELAELPEAHALFLREARIAGGIRHPSILEIYDFGYDTDGRPYFVMELARGPTLAQRLVHGPMPVWRALEVGIAVCDAVAAVHEAGYLHRDIKADNVMLGRGDDAFVAKLIDFGIACRLDSMPEPIAHIAGTPRVMAPEQVARDTVDERTDIWGLGVLLYEMISGQLPFDDMLATVTEEAPPLSDEVDEAVAGLIAACLNKDPEGRPWSAAALADELRDQQPSSSPALR